MEKRNIEDIKLWDKNPRGILDLDFKRLMRQLLKFGIHNGLLINQDDIVLGGNMRKRAITTLIDDIEHLSAKKVVKKHDPEGKYDITEAHVERLKSQVKNGVPVRVVQTENEKQMTEYALSDNDRAGYYEEDRLAEVAIESGINLDEFGVDLTMPKLVSELNVFTDPHDDDIDEDFEGGEAKVKIVMSMESYIYEDIRDQIDQLLEQHGEDITCKIIG